jgi:hypothetical protein
MIVGFPQTFRLYSVLGRWKVSMSFLEKSWDVKTMWIREHGFISTAKGRRQMHLLVECMFVDAVYARTQECCIEYM